jgi:hypothetical protein
VISTRDVIFDEKSHFDGKRESLTDTLIREKDELIKKAIMPEKLAANESIVQEDDDLISLYNSEDEDTIVVDTGHLEMGKDSHDFVCNSSNWPTSPQSNPDDQDDAQYASSASLLIRGRASPKGVEVSHIQANQLLYRLDDFKQYKVATKWEGAFNAGRYFKAYKRDLLLEPTSLRELEKHPLQKQFKEAQRLHLAEHNRMRTFKEVDRTNAKGQQILGCMWVFKYKLDKHRNLQKMQGAPSCVRKPAGGRRPPYKSNNPS